MVPPAKQVSWVQLLVRVRRTLEKNLQICPWKQFYRSYCSRQQRDGRLRQDRAIGMAEIQGVPHMCRSAVFAETNHRIPCRRDNGANQSS